MSADFKLDPRTRDLMIPLQIIEGAEQVTQAVEIQLRTWLGEWFLDTTHGVPYLEQILGKVPRLAVVESILRAQILSVKGMKTIDRFQMQHHQSSRLLEVEFEGTTSFGPIDKTIRFAVG